MKQKEISNNLWLWMKEVHDLKEENEILKDKNGILRERIEHLSNFLNLQDITGYIDNKVNFRDNNHMTIRNENGNLITYYTKETK